MFILPLVFLVGSVLNGLNTNPSNVADFNAAVLDQLNNPVVVAADYSTLN